MPNSEPTQHFIAVEDGICACSLRQSSPSAVRNRAPILEVLTLLALVRFVPVADFAAARQKGPLMTQSGHSSQKRPHLHACAMPIVFSF
jgi:hypothetical protein